MLFTRSHRAAGFTLPEVMVTVGIIAILTSIAIPSVLAWMPAIQLKDAASDLKGAIVQGRARAINGGIEHRLLMNNTNATYQVDRGNRSRNSTTWTPVIGPFPLANGVTYNAVSAGMEGAANTRYFRLATNGSIVTNRDQITVQLINEPADTYLITVQRRTGHVRLTKGG